MAGFLRVDPAKVKRSELSKVTPDDLSLAVVNLKALERRYRDGPFARFFED